MMQKGWEQAAVQRGQPGHAAGTEAGFALIIQTVQSSVFYFLKITVLYTPFILLIFLVIPLIDNA
jgi:hypothetical protein